MFKKNIIPICLLAVVVMLTVFYIKQPKEETNIVPSSISYEVVEKNPDFSNKRMTVIKSRSEIIEQLELEIASGTLTSKEIEDRLSQINSLYDLESKEVKLEEGIILLGYDDCFVEISDDYLVSISLISENFTAAEFIDIATYVKSTLSSNNNQVEIEVIAPTA